jgi:DNA invertase Pin-like site-specific DNA recombinase
MQAFGYVRISKLDKDTTSPQRQREAITRFCTERDWELVETFEDLDLSAYRKDVRRPGLERMLSRLGDVDRVVFWRLDRLYRGVVGFARVLEATQKAGVELVSVSESFDTASPMGRAMVWITATFAQLESDVLSERASAMHAYLRENGRWPGGQVPFGWRRGDDGLELHPDQQAVLADVASRYVAGESLRAISKDVGIVHPNLARMLKSDRVIDALPAPLAGRLVESLAERGRSGTRAKQSLLGGMARCGVCGAGMTVVGQRSHAKVRERVPWAAYACRERGHVSIARGWLDEHVSAAVLDAIDTGKLVERMAKRKRTPKALGSSEIEARMEILERDFYERGLVTRDSYLRRREGLLKRLAQARGAQEEAGIDLPREMAANLANVWPTLSLMGRRRIIAAVLQRVEIRKATSHGRIDPERVGLIWRT